MGFEGSWVIGHYPKMFKSAIVDDFAELETMVGTSDIGIGFPKCVF